MKILLIGDGAREHAIAWKVIQSPLLERLYYWGKNRAIAKIATIACCDKYNPESHSLIIDYCNANSVDLVIIGGEEPLFHGLADDLRASNIAVLGPNQSSSQIESSKIFAKQFCRRNNIPSANYQIFHAIGDFLRSSNNISFPKVLKIDGPAFGKGVTIVHNVAEAKTQARVMMEKYNSSILMEEYLEGREISYFIITNGTNYLDLGFAKDYKKALDGNQGNNTGGMGGCSAETLLSDQEIAAIKEQIIHPTLSGLKQAGLEYRGIIYFGIMLTATGPILLEYNVRFGDPEAQLILPRIKSDLLPLFYHCATSSQALADDCIIWHKTTTVGIVIATTDYAQSNSQSQRSHIQYNEAEIDGLIFTANMQETPDGYIATGGRLCTIICQAGTIGQARINCYNQLAKIAMQNCYYRHDIAKISYQDS